MKGDCTYENVCRVVYDFKGNGELVFVPVCEKCGRFVKADETMSMKKHYDKKPNATCSKCGRTRMLCEGFA